MKDNSGWLVIGGIGALAVAAALAYNLVAPSWGDSETSVLLAAMVACPTIGVMIGAVFLGLHWRDERQAARREREAAKRKSAVDRQGEQATVLGMNQAVMRQSIDMLSALAQAQARQAMAGLSEARRDAFTQRQDTPAAAPEEPWFVGDWQYDNEETIDETAGGIRYL